MFSRDEDEAVGRSADKRIGRDDLLLRTEPASTKAASGSKALGSVALHGTRLGGPARSLALSVFVKNT